MYDYQKTTFDNGTKRWFVVDRDAEMPFIATCYTEENARKVRDALNFVSGFSAEARVAKQVRQDGQPK